MEDVLVNYQITLCIGQTQIEPQSEIVEPVLAAIKAWNTSHRLEALDDELDPFILDPMKVANFIEGLVHQPDRVKALLRGRILYLNTPELCLSTSDPVTAENIMDGYQLLFPDVDELLIKPTLAVDFDQRRARHLIEKAHEATLNFHDAVERWEVALRQAEKDSPEYTAVQAKLHDACLKRQRAAIVWQKNSIMLTEKMPDDAYWHSEAQQAKQAASEYIVL